MGAPVDEGPSAKILDLGEATARFIIWARQSDDEEPFEVTKVVDTHPLPRCPTAPRCFDEPRPDSTWFDDPDELTLVESSTPPSENCPYHFADRSECVTARNMAAMHDALFTHDEAQVVCNYLAAIGRKTELERVPSWANDGCRLLLAHSPLGPDAECELLPGPLGCSLILVRQQRSWTAR